MKKQKTKAFGKDVYLLGKDQEGVYYWLEEASWDCDWYWGFGYVETYTDNKQPSRSHDIKSHQHFDSLFLKGKQHGKQMFDDFFQETTLQDKEKWTLIELMRTIYTLKEVAEVFYRGGSHYTTNPCKDILKNDDENKRINEVVLPALFEEVYKLLTPME